VGGFTNDWRWRLVCFASLSTDVVPDDGSAKRMEYCLEATAASAAWCLVWGVVLCIACFGRTGGGFMNDWRFVLLCCPSCTDVVPDDDEKRFEGAAALLLLLPGWRMALHVVVALWTTGV
jgi:hypothetical protein